MSLYMLLRGGADRVIALAKARQLETRFLWVAVRGAWKYASRVAMGDEAPDDDQLARTRICVACSAYEVMGTSMDGVQAGYCGRGNRTADGPTCGCNVTITIQGTVYPSGKLKVASEACPRAKFGKCKSVPAGTESN